MYVCMYICVHMCGCNMKYVCICFVFCMYVDLVTYKSMWVLGGSVCVRAHA